MLSETVYIGMDISKQSLDIYDPQQPAPKTIPNDRCGHAKLIRWLRSKAVQVICEATGGYERLVVEALQHANISVSLVNPRLIRDFARSRNILAKTDRLDARVLSAYGEANHPSPTPPRSKEHRDLEDWITRRKQVVEMLQVERCRLLQACDKQLKKIIQASIRALQKMIKQIEERLTLLLEQVPQIAAAVKLLCEIKGVGLISALSILAAMPELGTLNRRQAAALAGVAPYNRDSGTFKGKRAVWGGRNQAKRALYMVALVAARRNPTHTAFYKRLRENGKPGKVALVAVMRKLIIQINAIMKTHNLAFS